MKLKELTKEQEELMIDVRDEWINIFHNNQTFNVESVTKGIEWLYGFCKYDKPTVLIADSPMECQKIANDLLGNKKMEYITPSNYVNYSDAGWCSYHDFFERIGINKNEDFTKFKELMKNGCYYSILFENYAIISRPPVDIHQNEDLEMCLHNTKSAAISFSDGYSQFYVNGRYIESDIFQNAQTVEGARKEFFNTENEDIKAAIITMIRENEGDKGVLSMLNGVMVDERELTHDNGTTETFRLYKTKETFSFVQDHLGNDNQPYCWVEMKCPSTNAIYMLQTSSAFDNAIDAMKFSRPDFVPFDLEYNHLEFSN